MIPRNCCTYFQLQQNCCRFTVATTKSLKIRVCDPKPAVNSHLRSQAAALFHSQPQTHPPDSPLGSRSCPDPRFSDHKSPLPSQSRCPSAIPDPVPVSVPDPDPDPIPDPVPVPDPHPTLPPPRGRGDPTSVPGASLEPRALPCRGLLVPKPLFLGFGAVWARCPPAGSGCGVGISPKSASPPRVTVGAGTLLFLEVPTAAQPHPPPRNPSALPGFADKSTPRLSVGGERGKGRKTEAKPAAGAARAQGGWGSPYPGWSRSPAGHGASRRARSLSPAVLKLIKAREFALAGKAPGWSEPGLPRGEAALTAPGCGVGPGIPDHPLPATALIIPRGIKDFLPPPW